MNMKAEIVAAVALAGMLASGGAMAATGNQLLEWCKNVDNPAYQGSFTNGACLATVQTVVELMMGLDESLPAELRLCVPAEMTTGQGAKVAVKYMQENPELLHKGGVTLTLMAMQNAYPCK
jgi:type 1 fimbria pilin